MYLPPKGMRGLWLAAWLCLAATSAWAQEFVTINFPYDGKELIARGLSSAPRQVTTPDGVGYAELLLRPIHKDTHVFVTVVFEEDAGVGPALFWTGDATGRQMTLSENLGEGIVGLNRRTIQLPDEVANEAGHLFIMGRQDRVLRVRIDWCEPSNTFVAADQEQPSLIQGGTLKLDRDVTGLQTMTPPDAWFGPVLDAALLDGVVELSQNTELVVPLKGSVSEARLRAKFLGLPLGKAVRVWINGKLAGRLQPALPSLTDPGYVRRSGKRSAYAGWREGSLFIEPGTLRDGENSIVFESPGKGIYLSGAAMEIQSIASGEAPKENSATPQASSISQASSLSQASSAPQASPTPEESPTPQSSPATDQSPTPAPEASPVPESPPPPAPSATP
ncbi:MAG: hypothetical protein ACREKL_09650 [Chthoniobacterales bacterium]